MYLSIFSVCKYKKFTVQSFEVNKVVYNCQSKYINTKVIEKREKTRNIFRLQGKTYNDVIRRENRYEQDNILQVTVKPNIDAT